MRKCLRCGEEMTEGFVLMQELSVLLEIKLADDENALNKFGSLRAAVCPACGEVSLYTENGDLVEQKEEEPFLLCPDCGFPVYRDEEKCAHCGRKMGKAERKALEEGAPKEEKRGLFRLFGKKK